MKMLEFTAKYRTGTMIPVKNVFFIQEVAPEATEYQDGMITIVGLPTHGIYSTEDYATLSARFARLMEDEV